MAVRRWHSRRAAGDELASAVAVELTRPEQALILGLPRGGVAVAAPMAAGLGAELDVLVVRKAGVPWQPELAMGAITADGQRVVNDDVLARVDLSDRDIDRAFEAARVEAVDRAARLRPGRGPLILSGREVVIVDDGIATGATARAAARLLREAADPPSRTIFAAPVGPREVVEAMAADYDDVIVLIHADRFDAVGAWYDDFGQVPDETVAALLTH
jgi:putative phosphoribosyl transferase